MTYNQWYYRQELAAAKSRSHEKTCTALEDERNIHGMLNIELESGKTLLGSC